MNWRPEIGDPTVLGWSITIAYAATAWLCWRARVRENPRGSLAAVARFWTALAVGLALLCVNKQLDLQTLVTELARNTAKAQGWYANRRPVQVAAVVGCLGLVAVSAALTLRALHGNLRRVWPALAGVAVIGCYIAVRTTSLHELDELVISGPFPMKWWTELLGLALIAWSARA